MTTETVSTAPQPTNVVEAVWLYWYETVGGFGVFMTAYTIMALIYGLGSYVFYIIDNNRWLDAYKIQKGKYATKEDYLECARNLIHNYLYFILPIGIIFMEAAATFLPILIIRPHFFTFYSWFIIRQFDAVFTHCGYELPFPFSPFHWVPFFGGTTFHDYHHKAFTCNYASRFTYLDKIFGTYKEEQPDNKKSNVKPTIPKAKQG